MCREHLRPSCRVAATRTESVRRSDSDGGSCTSSSAHRPGLQRVVRNAAVVEHAASELPAAPRPTPRDCSGQHSPRPNGDQRKNVDYEEVGGRGEDAPDSRMPRRFPNIDTTTNASVSLTRFTRHCGGAAMAATPAAIVTRRSTRSRSTARTPRARVRAILIGQNSKKALSKLRALECPR